MALVLMSFSITFIIFNTKSNLDSKIASEIKKKCLDLNPNLVALLIQESSTSQMCSVRIV